MSRTHRFIFAEDDHEDEDRQTASLAGLAFALFLVIVGLFLINALHQKCAIEDCLLAGRTNCDMLLAQIR